MSGSRISSLDGKTIAIPQEVAQQLVGKEYKDFNQFRNELWKAIGNSKYASEFRPANQKRMKDGKSPFVIKRLQGSNGSKSSYVYNIDHTIEVQDGGYVYDLDNMTIIAPKAHEEKTQKESKKRSKKCEG
ncbi:hypothetical protein [Clostridium sp. HMSC19A10]|uniref:hypothetical protein n=1 Tax=Clostridium sp. HMSC19A10 TaxID=1581148 RepID=UPI0008A2B216|nr:hypothetical protein [Clostridium sp. HMSC19A10]OFS24188.1 hypothetical protein HMPREF3070_05920 [Clostridium sp. HMSC19A10]